MTRHYGDVALFTPARRRMARVPHGGILVDNPVSVAPGFQMENVFTFAGIPKVAEAMFQSMKHRLVGGDPVLSRTVRTNLPEGIIAEPLGALQKRYEDLDIGSYPAFRNGKPSVSLVLRGTDDARLAAAAAELMATIREDERRGGGVRPVGHGIAGRAASALTVGRAHRPVGGHRRLAAVAARAGGADAGAAGRGHRLRLGGGKVRFPAAALRASPRASSAA